MSVTLTSARIGLSFGIFIAMSASALADPLTITVGSTLITDNGAGDLAPAPNVIQFNLVNQQGTPGRFDASGTATLRINFGDDAITDVTLSDVSVVFTQIDPVFHFASAFIFFSAGGLNLTPARWATDLSITGSAPNTNTAIISNRLRGDLIDTPDFRMGEASAPAIPGQNFSNTQTRTSPLMTPAILQGNWGVQSARAVGTRIFLTSAVAEIHPASEPSALALLPVALAALGVSLGRKRHAGHKREDATNLPMNAFRAKLRVIGRRYPCRSRRIDPGVLSLSLPDARTRVGSYVTLRQRPRLNPRQVQARSSTPVPS